MKHVIVIETVDESEGGKLIDHQLANLLEANIDLLVSDKIGICVVRGTYNNASAIAAVHELYNAPKWDGGW
jgi:hypothetical protein